MSKDKREQLLDFINKKPFDVVLKTSPDNYNDEDGGKLEDMQRNTRNGKKQFEADF